MRDVEQDPLSPDAAESGPGPSSAVALAIAPQQQQTAATTAKTASSLAAAAAAASLERATAREQAALLEARAQEARELRAQLAAETESRRAAAERHLAQLAEKDEELRRLHESAARASRERAELRGELGVVHGELRALQRELGEYTSGLLKEQQQQEGGGGGHGAGGGDSSDTATETEAWRALRELHALSASLVGDSRQDAEQSKAREKAWRGNDDEGKEDGA
jgi:hypothetical protein